MTGLKPSRALLAYKHFLTFIGRAFSPRLLFWLQSTLNYLKMGRWMVEHGFHFENRVQNRREVWAPVVAKVQQQRLLYLEFGVASGESIRFWSQALKHPETILHGFDSFEGMPEDGGPWKKGQFSTSGQPPVLEDPRAKFFKGWFDQTLPDYAVPEHDLLIINVDADLYSSTAFVLRTLRPHIRKGTLIYFDEFNHPEHEPRAFEEFLAETKLKFVPVSGDQTLTYVFFRCEG
jgi:hypothetical protein